MRKFKMSDPVKEEEFYSLPGETFSVEDCKRELKMSDPVKKEVNLDLAELELAERLFELKRKAALHELELEERQMKLQLQRVDHHRYPPPDRW